MSSEAALTSCGPGSVPDALRERGGGRSLFVAPRPWGLRAALERSPDPRAWHSLVNLLQFLVEEGHDAVLQRERGPQVETC